MVFGNEKSPDHRFVLILIRLRYISIRDSNLNRFKEAFFGAFCRFLLACRQASGVGNNKNHSKNALFKVRSSFCEQFFCSDKENREVNPVGLTSGLTQYERKNCRKNRFVFGSLMLMPNSPEKNAAIAAKNAMIF